MGEQFEINLNNINKILKEMREHSKKYYGLKFKKRYTTIDYKHPIIKFIKCKEPKESSSTEQNTAVTGETK